jgi:acyl carrier protein
VLHELTRDIPLDFFVLYSSAAAILAAPGQGLYPAANAELDALARIRRQAGLPALSVAWGAWAGAGMAFELARRMRGVLQARGLGEIEPDVGFTQLERLLKDGAAYGVVIPIRWPAFLAQLPAGADRTFYSSVTKAVSSAPKQPPADKISGIVDSLKKLPSGRRRQTLCAYLIERIVHVLGQDPVTPIDPLVALKDIGLDSLMAVELCNELNRASGHSLPATLLFDYPTLDALTGYLIKAWVLEPDAAAPVFAADAVRGSAIETVAKLSEEAAEALLLEELERGSAGGHA